MYIYALYKHNEMLPFYIGQTQDMANRLAGHIECTNGNQRKVAIIADAALRRQPIHMKLIATTYARRSAVGIEGCFTSLLHWCLTNPTESHQFVHQATDFTVTKTGMKLWLSVPDMYYTDWLRAIDGILEDNLKGVCAEETYSIVPNHRSFNWCLPHLHKVHTAFMDEVLKQP